MHGSDSRVRLLEIQKNWFPFFIVRAMAEASNFRFGKQFWSVKSQHTGEKVVTAVHFSIASIFWVPFIFSVVRASNMKQKTANINIKTTHCIVQHLKQRTSGNLLVQHISIMTVCYITEVTAVFWI